MSGLLDELIITAEVVDVGEDAQCRSSILLITQRDDACLALLLDPSLGRRLALELRDDAGRRSHQGLPHATARCLAIIVLHLLLRQRNHLARRNEALALVYLYSLMSDNLF